MNIVLIGYRCTGKSSIGKRLAEILGWRFLDTDELLEQKVGMSIAEFVLKRGWDEFRKKEKEVINEISDVDNSVIATGGGVVLNEENVKILKKNGWIVWLKAEPDTIKQRMLKDKGNTRPSLKGKDSLDEIKEVLEERIPLYQRSSDFSLDTDSFSVEQLCNAIIKEFQRRIRNGIENAR